MPRRNLSDALFTDFYELTMAQAYWQSGMTADATFSLFFRTYPPDRAYFVFAGLADALEHLEGFRFSGGDISHLRSTKRLGGDFLSYLQELRFTGSVRAMHEGAIAFAGEPVLEVTAPVIEAQLLETFLINQINLQTVLATKASRVVHAAQGRRVVDFAARRTHGREASDRLARVSYMVGFAGTSNALAGGTYGIPTFGTMAHSFITAFDGEADAFRAYAKAFPDTSTFLVDTYDTVEGVRNAIVVAREMVQRGGALQAIRLDSGDLRDLARTARTMLDEAGLEAVRIFASGGLDELAMEELARSGVPIDGYGVGTKVGVSADAPWADCVYKMVAYDARPVLKLSGDKATLPGPKQVYRRCGGGRYAADVVACASEPPPAGAKPLLQEVMLNGKPLAPPPSLPHLRKRFAGYFERLPEEHKALRSPAAYDVRVSDALEELRRRLTGEAAWRQSATGGSSEQE
jgi:nicotinate phosphoribosyltransferase